MAASSNNSSVDSGFESAINTIFGYEISLEQLLWELCPSYFKIKCVEDFITTVSVCTSEDGKKVSVKVYVINELSFPRIAFIATVLDAMTCSVSDKWMPFSYSFQSVVSIGEEHKLNKYTFTTENHTNQDLAGKNKTFITSIR